MGFLFFSSSVFPIIVAFVDNCRPLATPTPKARIPKSTVKPRTLNPSWAASDIPSLPLNVVSTAQLQRCHLFLVVMDRDVAGDDRMGGYLSQITSDPQSFYYAPTSTTSS